MASFMNTYLDTQTNFSDDINLYSEGFKFDMQAMNLIEGQIALREIPILLEKEEIMCRMNLYSEAVGVIGGILSFIKSAITLMFKIFIGFKGLIIAVIVAFIGRFIIKKFKGGVRSYSGGGGGGGSSSASSAGNGAEAVVKSKFIAEVEKHEKELLNAGFTQADLDSLKDFLKSAKSEKEVLDYIDKLLNKIRVHVDSANLSALFLPDSSKGVDIIAKLNKCLEDDSRPNGKTYSEVLKSNPYYIFDENLKIMKDNINDYSGGNFILEDFLIDCIRYCDGLIAASYCSQFGILCSVARATGDNISKDYYSDIANELRKTIPTTTMRSIDKLIGEIDLYNGRSSLESFFTIVLRNIPNKIKPKDPKDYIKYANILSQCNRGKEVTTVKAANLRVANLVGVEGGVLAGVEYGGDSDKLIEYNCIEKFQKEFSSGFDMNNLKEALNKMSDLTKKADEYIQSLTKAEVKSKGVIDMNKSKQASSVAMNMMACSAQSITLMSHFFKNANNPIHNIILEDAAQLACVAMFVNEVKSDINNKDERSLATR